MTESSEARSHESKTPQGPEPPELRERGGDRDGQPQYSDRRLFMQFHAFTGCANANAVADAMAAAGLPGAVYEDALDPAGVGLATYSEAPAFFLDRLRPLLQQAPFDRMQHRPEYTMFGRTYAIGYEPDLDETLLHRPMRTLVNADWPWAVWYPLRRRGEFETLPADRQREILKEHGRIGFSFGRAGVASDIRLACFGLDRADNDFVIGLFGPELHPLSALVAAMRKTVQTSQYIERLGPFFVGRKLWQKAS